VSEQPASSVDDLKTGVVLCGLLNKIRPDTIRKVNNYTAPFRQMENIDNFLKVAEALGVDPEHKFFTEDLFYGNNHAKVILTLVALARAVEGQYSVPTLAVDDFEGLKVYAAASQIDGRKRTASDSQLSLFEMGAKKSQQQASAASRQGDRILLSTEKSVDFSGRLGFIDSGNSQAQRMISGAKLTADSIIMSTDSAVASSELGMIDAGQREHQKMISGVTVKSDNIIRSREEAVASADLGLLDRKQVETQRMISDATSKSDNIIRSRPEREDTNL